jgi:4-hydroxythreonine-4-phosphate dehydrogenase
MTIPRILITTGDPAGIGPDIAIQAAQQAWPAEIVVIADEELIAQRAQQIKQPITLSRCDVKQPPQAHQPGTLKIIPVMLNMEAQPGVLNPANSWYVIRSLETAVNLCESGDAHAMVTGPVNKLVINKTGVPFTGHTEFLAKRCNIPHTVMMFVTEQVKVALATTHVPISKLSAAITKDSLRATIKILSDELKNRFQLIAPKIFVCGLNPHAGEGGYLGTEEIDTIAPVLDELRAQGLNLIGPLPADTIFTPKYLKQADAILAMYHDQALPIVKYMSFGHAVNITLGLPFIRTSVDHGTAVDIAGKGAADAGSMAAAIELAISLAAKQPSLAG